MPSNINKIIEQSAETTRGTGINTTVKLHTVKDVSLQEVDKVRVVDAIGQFGPSAVAAQLSQEAEVSLEMDATYQDIRYLFNGLFTAISASTSTAGPPYAYPYTAAVASTQVVSPFSYVIGTSGAVYSVVGNILKHVNIKGVVEEVWSETRDFIAVSGLSTGTTLSTGLADRVVDLIRMADTKFYVDVSTGTVGTSTVGATLREFELDIETGRHNKFFAGSLRAGDWGEGRHVGKLRTQLEFNATAKAYVDEMLSTPQLVHRLIRIRGDNGGSSSGLRRCDLDFSGVIEDGVKLWDDADGNMVVDLTWAARYSTSMANWFKAEVQLNSSAAS